VESEKGRLWVHTASVGEFNTLKPLLGELKKDFYIVLTYFSFRAKAYLVSQKAYYDELYRLPIDTPFHVRSFERKVKPKAILIMERELWPFLLTFTRAPKVWINAYAKGGLLERLLSKSFDLIMARTQEDAERFKSYGSAKVVVCGNLKLSLQEPPPLELKVPESLLIVAGSTHPGEEELLLYAYRELRKEFKDLRLIVAPRHISRSQEVLRLFGEFKSILRTSQKEDWEVMVLDTLGELFSVYRYASVAFVGGTFVKVGGHNLLEPAYFSKPVLYGPYTQKVKDLKDFVESVGLGFEVGSSKELTDRLRELLKNPPKATIDIKGYASKVRACYLENLKEFLGTL